MMMKRAGIVMMGLLLPLGQAWSSEAVRPHPVGR